MRDMGGGMEIEMGGACGWEVGLVYPVWPRNLSTCSDNMMRRLHQVLAGLTFSLYIRYGMSSSGLATSPHTGHLLPSLSTIPVRAQSSHALPAQQGIITASVSSSLQMGHSNSSGTVT